MADSGGHWSTLAEAQKLTQSIRIPGVFETDIKRMNPMDRPVPVAQAANSGTSIKWLKEKVVLDTAVQELAVGGQLNWTENVQYHEAETALAIKALQRKLDHYVQSIYGSINNYRAQVLLEMEKGMKRKCGDSMIYNDITYGGANQFDGMHAQAALQTGTDLDQDDGEVGLSLAKLRALLMAMKQGTDEIWLPFEIQNWVNAAYEEKGFAGLAYNSAGTMASISRGISDIGKPVLFWDGIPFVATDYLEAEQANVGDGSNLRAKHTSGDKQYSLFAIKFGNLMEQMPGTCLAYGGTEGQGDFYKLVAFPNLENFDSEGMRMVSYIALLYSSKYALGRIFDIENVAITV